MTDPTTSDHVDPRARVAIKLNVPKSPLRKSSSHPFCCAARPVKGPGFCGLDRLVRSHCSF